MNRKDISKLRENGSIYFKIGMIIALVVVISAFNWTTYNHVTPTYQAVDLPAEIEIDVVRMKDKVKLIPPPPVIKITDNIIPVEQPEFTNLPEPKPLVSTEITNTTELKDFNLNTEPAIPTPPVVRPPEPETGIPEIISIAEEMPRFPGCEDSDLSKHEKAKCASEQLLNYVYKNIKYPALARENGIQGMVVIRFVVEKDGSISKAEVAREIGGGCGNEALRVVNSMPNWIPGKQRGRKVRVQFNLPVKFKLD